MTFGLSAAAFGGLVAGGTALATGAMASNAAGKAADQQAQGTRESNALQKEMFDKQVALQQPALDAGNMARNKLLYGLGLGGGTGTTGAAAPAAIDREAIRAQLMQSGRYNTAPAATTNWQDLGTETVMWNGQPMDIPKGYRLETIDGVPTAVPPTSGGGSSANIDADIEAEYQRQLQAQQATQVQTQQAAEADPNYGALTRTFGQADLDNDVVYRNGLQFGLDQGQQSLDRQAAARGGYQSGAAIKAATRFGNDYGTTKAAGAFDRFQVSNAAKINPLLSLSGSGQIAANTLGASGMNYATNVGNTITSNANAQGAAGIASANGWTNALSNGVNNYQQQNFQNSLLNRIGPNAQPTWGTQSNSDIAKLWE